MTPDARLFPPSGGSDAGFFRALVRRSLRRGSFTGEVATLAGGTALAQVLTVLSSPALTRLYAPDDLGRLGVYLSFVGFASAATSLRYETAIVSAVDRSEAAHLTVASLLLSVPVSVGLTGLLYYLIDSSLLGFGVLSLSALPLAAGAMLLSAFFLAFRYWHLRERNLALISRVTVVQSGIRAAAQVAFGVASSAWTGLAWGDLLGRTFGLGQMVRIARGALAEHVTPLRKGAFLAVLRAYRKFPLYSLPSSLLDTLALTLPIPLIAQLYGPQAAGYFAMTQRVLALPVSLVGGSVADAFHGRLALYARESPQRVRGFFWKTAGGLLALGLGPTLAVMAFGPGLFLLVFGRQWRPAGELAVAVAPWALAQMVVSPLSRAVFVFQGQEHKFVYDGLSLLTLVGVLFVGRSRGLPLVETVAVLSALKVLSYAVYFLLLLRVVRKGGGREEAR